jgi:hypothetical protein
MESHEDDPRGKDVAEGGYPEEQHPGADPAEGTRKRDGGGKENAPGTSSENESGPEEATGNPGAAGG